ncbi:MAG: rubredoxin [Halioglobus sp.]|jgi:rubredoxin
MAVMSDTDFKKYECVICGFIYDEAEGLPDDGIKPGTKWADVPEDWECPDCGISKTDFDLYEE